MVSLEYFELRMNHICVRTIKYVLEDFAHFPDKIRANFGV